MPITHHVRDDGVLVTVATGTVTVQDLLDHLRSHVEDPDLHSGMAELIDMRGIERVDVATDGLRNVIAFERDHLEVFRGARLSIAAPADLPYGLSRMYQMMTDEGEAEVAVHRTLEEAEAWLTASGEPQGPRRV